MEETVNKLRIISLPKPDSSLAGPSLSAIASAVNPKEFEVQINPEQISRNFSIKYHEPSTAGTNGSEFQFEKVNPEEMELRFILDGTGAALQNSTPTPAMLGNLINALPEEARKAYVPLKVLQLQTAVYDFIDEEHRTPFLLVLYGKLVFMGLLMDMSVNYTLFSPAGIPLRAEVSLKLKAHTPFKDSADLLSLLSPDLTRSHKVQPGENILRICLEVYGNEKYYLEVARANGIANFRSIEPGTVLIIPPLNKIAAS